MFRYHQIPNHFSFADVYDAAVAHAPDPAVFVEVDTWFGASAAYLASKIMASGKHIEFYAIDNFTADGSGPLLLAEAAKVGGDFYHVFCENMEKCGVAQYVRPQRRDSTAAAKDFADKSVDFAYLDACHEYEKVKQDILAWLPKIKAGGALAGHDYSQSHHGVMRAVNEIFHPNAISVMTHSWVYQKVSGAACWRPGFAAQDPNQLPEH